VPAPSAGMTRERYRHLRHTAAWLGYYGNQLIVGITNSAPSFTPVGQREVTVFVLV
jgi:hypothetical protein